MNYPYTPGDYSSGRPIYTRTFLWAVNRRMAPAGTYEEKKEVSPNCLFRISKIRAYGTEDSLAHVRLTMVLPRGNAFESIPLLYFLQERNVELDSVQTATVRLECDAQANALVEVIFEGVQSR